MRISISLDDQLAGRIRREAADRGQSVSEFIARILDDALRQHAVHPARPFRLVTVAGGGTYLGVDLDQTSALLVAEDGARCGSRPNDV